MSERRLARYWWLMFSIGTAIAIIAGVFHEPLLDIVAGLFLGDGVIWLIIKIIRSLQ